jgi:hypothetical protein
MVQPNCGSPAGMCCRGGSMKHTPTCPHAAQLPAVLQALDHQPFGIVAGLHMVCVPNSIHSNPSFLAQGIPPNCPHHPYPPPSPEQGGAPCTTTHTENGASDGVALHQAQPSPLIPHPHQPRALHRRQSTQGAASWRGQQPRAPAPRGMQVEGPVSMPCPAVAAGLPGNTQHGGLSRPGSTGGGEGSGRGGDGQSV